MCKEERKLPSTTISHLICSMALIALIFVTPFFYFYTLNHVQMEMIKKELKEVTDYVSHTLENLFLLANLTEGDVFLKKELSLPFAIKDSTYFVEIVEKGGNASSIHAYLEVTPYIQADSWLIPGLKVGASKFVESHESIILAGCERRGMDVFIWIFTGE